MANQSGAHIVSIGKLNLDRKDRIGFGKYSSVFKGKFEDKKTVAIKRLQKHQSRVDSHLLSNGGGHPYILAYFCIEDIDVEFIYLATDLCAGNLEDYISNKKRWSKLVPKEVCRQMALGLEHLHSLEIVHGDLKPSNISFPKGTVGSEIKLSDFGLRHIPERARKGYSVLNYQKGRVQAATTFGWKPRDAKIDLPFDVFSLACVICYTLTKGRHPFGDTVEVRVHNIGNNCIAVTSKLLVEAVEEAAAVFKMLQHMLNAKSELRPKVPQLLTHPFFNRSSATAQPNKNRIWNFKAMSATKRIKLEKPEATSSTATHSLATVRN